MTVRGFLGVALLYAALAVGGGVGVGLAAAGALLLVWAGYSPRDGLLLLGPFAGWELVRATRISFLHVWRPLIAVVVLLIVYMTVVVQTDQNGQISQRDLTRAAGVAFTVIGVLAAVLSAIIAVAYLPGVITEEREKNRLEHLFVTDLRNRELLVGKVVGRLAVLAGYLAVPLPVLALLTLVGGVDPLTVAVLGAMALATLAAVAGVSVGCSSVCKKTSSAVLLTLAVLGGLQFLAHLLTDAETGLRFIPAGAEAQLPAWVNKARVSAADACGFLAGGSPTVAYERLDAAVTGMTAAADAGQVLRSYLAGQLLLLAVGWAVASRYLRRPPRPVGATGGTRGFRAFFAQPPRRPAVWNHGILWYDLTTPLSVFDRVGRKMLVGVWWVPAVLAAAVLAGLLWLLPDEFDYMGFDHVMRWSGFFAFLGITVPTGWVGCRGVVRERERDTLDALLLTDLTPSEIVRQKWLAAALSARGRVLLAAAVWFTYGLFRPPFLPAAVVLTLVTPTYAALAAAIGVWVSVRSKNGNKAFLSLVLAYAGWTVGSCFVSVFAGCLSVVVPPVGIGLYGLLASVNPLAVQSMAGYIGVERGSGGDLFSLVLAGICLFALLVAGGATVGFLVTAQGHFTRLRRPKPRRRD